mmetsp:Transcript_24963/g.27930  ORF Transcript_24963/g.27930 Transcript_24963/m.27930 type:complete len:304 (-) Transcript_24963:61-972(-)
MTTMTTTKMLSPIQMTMREQQQQRQTSYVAIAAVMIALMFILLVSVDEANAFSSKSSLSFVTLGSRNHPLGTTTRFSTITTSNSVTGRGVVFMTSDNNNGSNTELESTSAPPQTTTPTPLAAVVEQELGTTAALQEEYEQLKDALDEEKTVFMRSLLFDLDTTPFGITLEEIESGGVYCVDCDVDGAAYAAGVRDGDVIAALNGKEEIRSATLEGAMTLLGAETSGGGFPISIKVYRPMNDDVQQGKSRETTIVKMAPRRLPSAKKLVMASTNAKFWQDPLMIGSAVLTVAMPLGIYIASKGM